MAESFSNFLTSKEFTEANQTIDIVPEAANSISDGIGSRVANSVSQIHSIYITKREYNATQYIPTEKDGAYINIYIYDNTKNDKYYLAHNVCVLPCSSFYIEKTITLLTNQSLKIEYSEWNKDDKGEIIKSKIDCICSGIDIVK